MGRPRLHRIRNTLTAVVAAGAIILTMTGRAAALGPWQKAWGDYDSHNQWHDASWWLENQHHWVTVHHPEWTENYAETRGQIGDYDRLYVWHYGDGSFDRSSTGLTIDEPTDESPKVRGAASKPDMFVTNVHKPQGRYEGLVYAAHRVSPLSKLQSVDEAGQLSAVSVFADH